MKTLIIYASIYGFSEECVNDLKNQINGDVETFNVASEGKPQFDHYDNIVIGGPIYMGKLPKKLTGYVSKNIPELSGKRLALFICCGLPENFEQHIKNNFPAELTQKAVAVECFGGELRTDKMNFGHKMITQAMEKAQSKEGKSKPAKIPENIQKLAAAINQNEFGV